MKLNLRRFLFEENTTLGMLHINNVFECFTCEDIPREVKIKHETAIPTGVYRIILTDQNKWAKLMPKVLDVPQFQGIYLHKGLTKDDSSGCILVGEKIKSPASLENSTFAFDRLMGKFRALDGKEDIIISVENYVGLPL